MRQHPRHGNLVSVGHMKILSLKEDSPEYLSEIKFLHESDGFSLRKIASIVGKDHHWVARRLRKAGGSVKSHEDRWKGYTFTCVECSQLFNQKWKGRGRKFCSQACYKKYYGRQDGVMAEKTCPECGKLFKPHKAGQVRCSRKCFEKSHATAMAGDSNPSWLDGRSYDKRCHRGLDWDTQKKKAYERDKYTCQNCGVKCVGRNGMNKSNSHRLIQCHHIVFWSEAQDNSLENLITLCVSCHKQVHLGSVDISELI